MLHSGGVGLLRREKGSRGFLHFGREVHVYVYLSCLGLICLLWCLGMALGIVHGFLHAFHEFLKVLGKQEYLVLLVTHMRVLLVIGDHFLAFRDAQILLSPSVLLDIHIVDSLASFYRS